MSTWGVGSKPIFSWVQSTLNSSIAVQVREIVVVVIVVVIAIVTVIEVVVVVVLG